MSESKTLTCVYCGHEYPEGTPPHGHQLLTEHIKICEKHPMRELESQNKMLRSALAGLVGVDSKSELEGMEAVIRVVPAIPEQDRANTLNAIHALIATLK